MISALSISYHAPDNLIPYANNARTHSNAQIKQIAKSIKTFGFTNPVLITSRGNILAGHGRVQAAKHLGLANIPAIIISDLTEEQQRALILADNKIAQNAGWNPDLLKLEIGQLAISADTLDLTVTGFDMGEIDVIIGTAENQDSEGPENTVNLVPDETRPPIAQRGDIWLLGDHKILCTDSLNPKNWQLLMGDSRAQMGFSDPPYNVPINGHVSGKGKNKHREFEQASGEMTQEAFKAFLTQALAAMHGVSLNGSLHYVCMDWRHIEDLLNVGCDVFDALKNICVWNKTNGGMGSLYRSRHEMIPVFKKGKAAHINNIQLGRYGRYRSNVWTYAGANSFSKTRDEDLSDHPTVKPLALVKDAILDATHIGDIVIDGFLGSGTTLLAAQSAQRLCYGMELDPLYVDVVLRRFQTQTGIEPILAATGAPLTQVRTDRASHQTLGAQP